MRVSLFSCALLLAGVAAAQVPPGQAIATVQVGPSTARKGEVYFVDLAKQKATQLTIPTVLQTKVPNCVTMTNAVIGYMGDQGVASSTSQVPADIYRVLVTGTKITTATKLNTKAHGGYNLSQIAVVGGKLYYTTADKNHTTSGFYDGFLYELPAAGGAPTQLADFSTLNLPTNHTPNAVATNAKSVFVSVWPRGQVFEWDIANKKIAMTYTLPTSKRTSAGAYPVHSWMKTPSILAVVGLYGDIYEVDVTTWKLVDHFYEVTRTATGLSLFKNSFAINRDAGDYVVGTRDGHVEVYVPDAGSSGHKAERFIPGVGSDATGTNNSINGLWHHNDGGSYLSYGAGCPGPSQYTPTSISGGAFKQGNASFAFGLGSAFSPTAAVLIIGAGRTKIDLTGAGAPGCFLYTIPALLLPAPVAGSGRGKGKAMIPLPLPPIQILLNTQWVVIDAAANSMGLLFSDGREGKL